MLCKALCLFVMTQEKCLASLWPVKPLISYYGGKQRMSSKIIPLIPKHTVYVEPFAGGASVFFAKPWPDVSNSDHYREALNDLNGEIVNLYRCFQDKTLASELIHRLQFNLYSRAEYSLAREIYKNPTAHSQIDRAWATYVNAEMSFAGKMSGGWGTAVFTANLASTWAKKVSRLTDYLERMSSVYIEQDDALKVIERWDSPQTFFYCDPPYPGANQGHYSGYSHEDFNRLINTLHNCQGSFLLSCYGFENSHRWREFKFEAHCTASGQGMAGKGRDKSRAATSAEQGNRKRVEHVYFRTNSKPVRSEIQALFDSGKFDCFTGGQDDKQLELA